MLHRLNPIDDDGRIVRLTQIVSALIEFLCHPDNPFCEDKPDDLKSRIAATCPDPLMVKWISNPQGKHLKQKITSVAQYLAAHPDQRVLLRSAFQHDVEYHQHLNETDFAFAFSQLDTDLQAHIQSLMVYLYEYLGDDGYPIVVMGDKRTFSRGDYLVLWEERNGTLNVCPACDGKKPDIGRKKHRLSDLDHFLPKSVYPLLALHPRNLVPICIECNQRIKGEIDPLADNGAVSFSHSFHPYTPTPAVNAIEVICKRDPNGVPHVKIEDRDLGGQSARVVSLDRIFGLDDRWASRMPEVEESLLDKISGWIDRFVSPGIPSDEKLEAIRVEIEADRDRVKVGSQQNRILYRSYLSFVLLDDVEFEEITYGV
jgi:hypothetical protein